MWCLPFLVAGHVQSTAHPQALVQQGGMTECECCQAQLSLIQKYCVECHGGKKVKAKLDFTKIVTDRDVDEAFELWEDVVDVLKHGDMPPEEKPQPSKAERAASSTSSVLNCPGEESRMRNLSAPSSQ